MHYQEWISYIRRGWSALGRFNCSGQNGTEGTSGNYLIRRIGNKQTSILQIEKERKESLPILVKRILLKVWFLFFSFFIFFSENIRRASFGCTLWGCAGFGETVRASSRRGTELDSKRLFLFFILILIWYKLCDTYRWLLWLGISSDLKILTSL